MSTVILKSDGNYVLKNVNEQSNIIAMDFKVHKREFKEDLVLSNGIKVNYYRDWREEVKADLDFSFMGKMLKGFKVNRDPGEEIPNLLNYYESFSKEDIDKLLEKNSIVYQINDLKDEKLRLETTIAKMRESLESQIIDIKNKLDDLIS